MLYMHPLTSAMLKRAAMTTATVSLWMRVNSTALTVIALCEADRPATVQAAPPSLPIQTDVAEPGHAVANGGDAEAQSWTAESLAPSSEIDESLFLVRWADVALAEAIMAEGPRDELGETLVRQRSLLTQNRERAAASDMPTEVIALHDAILKQLDIYCDYLIEVDALRFDFARQHKTIDDKGFSEGLLEGAPTGLGLAAAGVEPLTAAVVIGGQMIKKYNDQVERHGEIETARDATVRQRSDAYQRSAIAQRAKITAFSPKLADALSCSEDEIGLVILDDDAKAFAEAAAREDLRSLLEYTSQLIAARPRDAFPRRERGQLLSYLAMSFSSARRPFDDYRDIVSGAVEDFLHAVRLVPSGSKYDGLRAELRRTTAFVAWLGCVGEEKESAGAIRFADAVCMCADSAVKLAPRRELGVLAKLKGYALAKSGRHEESLRLMERAARDIGGGADGELMWATVYSLASQPAKGMIRLKAARSKGYKDIRSLWGDPDLQTLRNAPGGEFERLVKPSSSHSIEYGIAWNDLHFQNTSDFPLTAVLVRFTRVDNNNQTHQECYWSPEIGPGETALWQGVFDNASLANEVTSKRALDFWCNEKRKALSRRESDVVGQYRGSATLSSYEGDNIQETSALMCEASIDERGDLEIRFSDHAGTALASWSGVTLNDGVAAIPDEAGGNAAAILLFDGKRAFGYFRTRGDREGNRIRAFCVERGMWW